MEEFPALGEKHQFPYTLSIYPFLLDHRIPSGAILPAVHSMQLLVGFINQHTVEFDTYTLLNASFGKLLFLPDDKESIETWIEIKTLSATRIHLALLTKSRSRSGITRSFPHASFELAKPFQPFGKQAKPGKSTRFAKQKLSSGGITDTARNPDDQQQATGFGNSIKSDSPPYSNHCKLKLIPQGNDFNESIPVSDIYPGLVCFEEGFQNVTESVRTSEAGAITKVSGGKPVPGPAILGSPFPLDAAFQAACAWGRKYTGQICYPVAFEKRRVFRPTQASDIYDVEILPLNLEGTTLEFDLLLKNSQGRIMEQVVELKMREIGIGTA